MTTKNDCLDFFQTQPCEDFELAATAESSVNGGPAMAPKTTTGPVGSGSKTESPATANLKKRRCLGDSH
jgi:hypothetical protein